VFLKYSTLTGVVETPQARQPVCLGEAAMHITTPAEIQSVAWEGELVAPVIVHGPGKMQRPVVTIGRPEECVGIKYQRCQRMGQPLRVNG
jgi:hypothetical protein